MDIAVTSALVDLYFHLCCSFYQLERGIKYSESWIRVIHINGQRIRGMASILRREPHKDSATVNCHLSLLSPGVRFFSRKLLCIETNLQLKTGQKVLPKGWCQSFGQRWCWGSCRWRRRGRWESQEGLTGHTGQWQIWKVSWKVLKGKFWRISNQNIL